VKLSNIKPNPQNPRLIKDERFKKLVQSIKDFPEMMAKRPMVCVTDVDGKLFPLGGNMRLKALKEAGYTDIPDEWVTMADEWTQEQRNEFIIKDNISFGEHDWDALKDWDTEQLEEWGLDVPEFATEVDYSILDDEDVEDQLNDMTNGVKKAIQIEFEADHYEEAYELVKFWREQGGYVGGMIMEFLKAEKEKI
jgi:ParB-like chromosome segregation protein Spo0J